MEDVTFLEPWQGQLVAVDTARALGSALHPNTTGDVPPQLAKLVAATAAYHQKGGVGPGTAATRLYQWSTFVAWCAEVGVPAEDGPLPATPEILAAYLFDRCDQGHAKGTLRNDRTAVSWVHRETGQLPNPDESHLVRNEVWPRVARAARGRGTGPAEPLTFEGLVAILNRPQPEDLTPLQQLRALKVDALVTLCWFCALRLDEARRMLVDDWLTPERRTSGQLVALGRTKTDRTGKGTEVLIRAHAGPLRPVDIIDRWVEAAGLRLGEPLLPSTQHGIKRPLRRHTNCGSLRGLLARAGVSASLDVTPTGHSARRGFVQHALTQGVPEHVVMQHTRHSELDTLRAYAGRGVAGDTAVPDAVLDAVLGD